ncbi:DUF6090 family protein [Aestuariivivens sediminicola]|uniref:DUF6090 family protein n=1 Tax=Aestuariivivens sediminicola TaxID=2913560 RepID=UPI001F59A482|nr:DUF6090 family protein [Aestuariivivens sediminicola]
MIKFFRQIRQRLLSEGKTTKYLKYAVGEIVLVVIGILIALSINNWNEERKKNISLGKALGQVIIDLKQDEETLKMYEEMEQKHIQYLEALSYRNYNNIKLDSILYNLDHYFSFIESNNSYSNLKSSGLFTEIENDSLKSNLTLYYEQAYGQLKDVTEYGETFTNDRIIPFLLLNLNWDDNFLVDEKLVKEKIATTNLIQLAKYQINVKKYSIPYRNMALALNNILRIEIKKEIDNLK